MQADEFEPPSETGNDHLGKRVGQTPDREPLIPTTESSRRPNAQRAAPAGSATAVARYQYTLSAVLITFVIAVVGLFLLTDSRVNDLESRLGAKIALASTPPAPADNSNQIAAINGINDRLDALQTALDELRAQSDAGKEPDAASLHADTGVSETGPTPQTESKTETKVLDAKVEAAQTETPVVATSKQIAAPAQAVQDKWLINIASFSQQKSAQQMQSKLVSLGQIATTEPVNLKGKKIYRVRITGLPDRKAAESEALRLQKVLQLSGFWVAKDPGSSDAQ
ncbi:SPOR domain-containing protein [Marinobacterium sedimentorum]|uniref:SPOR domain-containing protein n=1 Tax=Marinobacterium sedimentorum TaxID=2927804 RepID=UPI0020C72173|nr:SPOR domain-containing protein [Marinobacterium sedimentorum]MCP8687039.1 SPOR domain-containing protein [Marinobacterium sedimentorum]